MKSINSHSVSGYIGKEITTSQGRSASVTRFTLIHSMGKDREPLYIDMTLFSGTYGPDVDMNLLQEKTPVVVDFRMAPNTYEKDGRKTTRIQNIVTGIRPAEDDQQNLEA